MKSVKDSLIKKFKEISPGLPLIEEGSVLKKIECLFQTSVKAKANRLKGSNLKTFQEKLDLLFDIILCHCQFLICGGGERCTITDSTGFHVHCACPLANRIAEKDVSFVKDQREKIGLLGGKMWVMGREKKIEKMLQKKAEKEEKSEKRAEKRAEEAAKVEQLIKQRKEESSITLESPDVDYATLEDEEEYIGETEKVTRQTRINIETFVAEIIRAKNSPGSAAAIWNAVIKCLEDRGVIKNEDETSITTNLTVDRAKVRRAMNDLANKEKEKNKETTKYGIECIGVDGKKDKKTLINKTVEVNGVKVKKNFVGQEEHITYTNESSKGEYLTHSTQEEAFRLIC